MRIPADENFPGRVVALLRERGHDVLWVRVEMSGAADTEVLARAQADGRLLVTFDKDFGELAFRCGLPASCGVVLVRLSLLPADEITQILLTTLEGRSDWPGQFSVIEKGRVRQRLLPGRN